MKYFEKKLVAVLNEKKESGVMMNALAHMCFGLGASIENKEECHLTNYQDAGGNDHRNISEMPFIILKANGSKIRILRKLATEKNIHTVDFTHTMTNGAYEEQKERSKQTTEENLEYYGIVLFGDRNTVTELTQKFSLWR